MEVVMKSVSAMSMTLLMATAPCIAQQVVGSTQLGVAYAELRDVTTGLSTKKQVLGKKVFNDNGDTVGKIDDIIVSPDKAVSYAIVRAGGFLGVGRHDVAYSSEPAERGWWQIHPCGRHEGCNQGHA
jgi:hypothetical protein